MTDGTPSLPGDAPSVALAFDPAGRHRRHWVAAVILSLIWLALPLGAFVATPPSPTRTAVVSIALLAFVALHLSVMFCPRRQAWQRVAFMVAIACALTLADRADWSALFVFAAVAAGFRLRPPQAWYVIGACAPLAAATTLLGGGTTPSAVTMGVTAPAVGFVLLALARLLRANVELRGAREQLAAAAVVGERLRFARDLHDLLGHSLSVIALQAEVAEKLLVKDAGQAAEAVGNIKHVAREALDEVRQVVSGYREPRLVTELAGARFALSAAGVKMALIERQGELPPEIDCLFAWAVREGTTNVIRHSGAHNCRIVIRRIGELATLDITDDGRGTTVEGLGNGIAGLRERAARMLGSVKAGPDPRGGFHLGLTAPIGQPDPREEKT